MLNVGIIGIGNAGSQVAALAHDKLKIDAFVINSSENDLQTIPEDIPRILVGDTRGAGKERGSAKVFLKDSIMTIMNDKERVQSFKKDILFVVSSTGGGTGSGIAPMLGEILSSIVAGTKIIIVGILPTLKEALSTQLNSIEYLEELYNTIDGATYMLYDNNKLASLPSTTMMKKINQTIVDDIDVIRGTYQTTTQYSSIDEKDAMNIMNTSGRIVIVSLRDLKEKDIDEITIEELLINQFKVNAHCEIQRDKIIQRTGIISNLEERINDRFDSHIPTIQEFIGVPVEEFEHIVINADRHQENSVFLIAAGMTQVNDRIRRINDRIEEIQERQKQIEEESELNSIDLGDAKSKVNHRGSTVTPGDNIDLKNIFSKFNV